MMKIGQPSQSQTLESRLDNLSLNEENKTEISKLSQPEYTKEEELTYSEGNSGGIWRVMSLDSNRTVSASYDHLAKIWTKNQKINETMTLNESKVLRFHKREVLSLARLDENVFLTGSSDGIMCFWNSKNGSLVNSFKDRVVTGFYSIAVIDNKTVATGSCQKPQRHHKEWNHVIKIWDISRNKFLFDMKGHLGGVSSIIKLNEKLLASSSGDRTIRIWNILNQNEVGIFKSHKDYVYGLAKLVENLLISGSRDRTMKLLDSEYQKEIGEFVHKDGFAHASTIYDVSTYNGNVAASASRDGYIKIWDSRSLKCIKIIDTDDGFVYSVGFSIEGNIVAGTSGKADSKKKDQRQAQSNGHVLALDFRKL